MIPKQLEVITEEDLLALIEAKASESRTSEFKLQPPKKESDPSLDDKNRAEFLKDVTAFANSRGGDLVYGMTETAGVASKLLGFETENIDAEIRRLTQLVRNQTEPTLSDIYFHPIHLPDDKYALVVRVTRSWIGPHRVRMNAKFFSRNSMGVSEMDVWELRTAFLSSSVEKEIKQFRLDNTSDIF